MAESKGSIKIGAWSFIIGAFVMMIVGLKVCGWTTPATTQMLIDEATDEAVLASQAAICVAQFMKNPKYKEQLQELQKLEYYRRQEVITKGGWDKMPGQKEADSNVARECAEELDALIN
jgi:hypothetical protein